jgi:hypothetical protein
MTTEAAQAAQAEQGSAESVAGATEERTYVISEQELKKLKLLAATELAVRIIHSIDGCPECPETFGELWEQAGSEQAYVAQTVACLAACMVDDVAELHRSSNKVNDVRVSTLLSYAGSHLMEMHLCREGHTGCIPASEE